MSRGLPYALVVHVIVLTVLAIYGGHVAQPPRPSQRIFRVTLTKQPQTRPQETAPQDQLPEQQPEPQPQVIKKPELPPKELPKLKPQEPKPEPKEQEPEPIRTSEPEPDLEPSDAPAMAAQATGPAVSSTDVDFPFAYYLNLIEGRITRNWKPKQLGFREGTSRFCVIHFVIARNGHVSRVSMSQSSGVALFDRESLRAVQDSSPLPPLPAKFSGRDLPVSMIFTLEPGF